MILTEFNQIPDWNLLYNPARLIAICLRVREEGIYASDL
jgi:hypothetical protein